MTASLESHLVSREGSTEGERGELLPALEQLVRLSMTGCGGVGDGGAAGAAEREREAANVGESTDSEVALAAAARLLRKLRRRRPGWRGGDAEATLFARAVAPRAPADPAAATTPADPAAAAASYLVEMRVLARLVPLTLPPLSSSSSSASVAAAFVAKCVAHASATVTRRNRRPHP